MTEQSVLIALMCCWLNKWTRIEYSTGSVFHDHAQAGVIVSANGYKLADDTVGVFERGFVIRQVNAVRVAMLVVRPLDR
jgi:hypothetical protein